MGRAGLHVPRQRRAVSIRSRPELRIPHGQIRRRRQDRGGGERTVGTTLAQLRVGEASQRRGIQAYRRLYTYDHTDLAPKIESADDRNPDWKLEKISFAAAYGQERMLVYLFLPKETQPPYQTVIFMPGSPAWDQRSPPAVTNPQDAFLMRSGRAVAFPIYKGCSSVRPRNTTVVMS